MSGGKITLWEFFETDQKSQDQTTLNNEQLRGRFGAGTDGSQLYEQSQNPIQKEMSHFVAEGNLINDIQKSQFSQIGKNDDENDK